MADEIDREWTSGLVADAAELEAFDKYIIAQFRANKGVIAEGPLAGELVLLLHAIGAKSGEPRLHPLVYKTFEGKWYIAAGAGGAPKDPAWAHNLRANPRVKVELGAETYEVNAREVSGEERDRIEEFFVKSNPAYRGFKNKTTRVIPLFELVR